MPNYNTTLPGINHYIPPTNEGTKRYRCPVHHGKNRSVAVGYIGGRAWAKCFSHGCAQSDILAALGLSNSQSPWTPPPPRLRPTISAKPLPPVSHTQAAEYLLGIGTPSGAGIAYQRDDGQRGRHWRNPDKRRNPGVTGDGWQLRRFDPANPASALVIALSEGEKDAALLASSGVIAFTAPRGAQSLPLADFTELVALAKDTGLPVVLCGDNDKVGREAMVKVRGLLKRDHRLDASYLFGPEAKGSVADFPVEDLKALIRVKLSDRKPSWQKPIRNRAEYVEFKCPSPKRKIKKAGDVAGIYGTVPCGNTATCPKCAAWENYLHIERCWKGNPAQMVQVSGFGDDGSTIPQTTWLAKVYRSHFEERLRRNAAVNVREELPSGKRQHFMTALALGHDYRASLAVFFAQPLPEKEIAKERRRAERAGLSFTVKNVVARDDIENAAPPSLTIHMDGEGSTTTTHCWTASHWPTWWQPDTTYAFSDGVDLADGEDFPADSISARDWKREYHQEWDITKTLKENLIRREEYALFNSTLWMTNCFGLSLETLEAIARGEDIAPLVAEVGDYQGPTALLRDTAEWLVGRGEWRKAYRPVLIAAGWRG